MYSLPSRFAVLAGFVIGTYSSIFASTPIVYTWKVGDIGGREHVFTSGWSGTT